VLLNGIVGIFQEVSEGRILTESSAPLFLPDENGPLSKEVRSLSICEANVEVSIVVLVRGKRKPYLKVPDDKKVSMLLRMGLLKY